MDKEIKIFNEYYSRFDDEDLNIHRKYTHTFRVVGYAERIAKSLSLSEEDVTLAKVCALFHDIGRFVQWRDYQTFEDFKSVDHGDLSASILDSLGYENDIVRIAVKYHNKYAIPDDLSEREKMFCNITRDADKIDILETQKVYDINESVYKMSPEIKEDIDNERLVDNRKYDKDGYSLYKYFSFLYDLNYPESFKILKKLDLINKQFDIVANVCGEEFVKDYRKKFNDYLNERIG